MQAQAGETDGSTEPNVKAAINATEHAHSTPQPEKVHTLHKHVYSIHSYIQGLWRRTKRRCLFLSQVSLSSHIWLSIWQQKAADNVGYVVNRQTDTLLQCHGC